MLNGFSTASAPRHPTSCPCRHCVIYCFNIAKKIEFMVLEGLLPSPPPPRVLSSAFVGGGGRAGPNIAHPPEGAQARLGFGAADGGLASERGKRCR